MCVVKERKPESIQLPGSMGAKDSDTRSPAKIKEVRNRATDKEALAEETKACLEREKTIWDAVYGTDFRTEVRMWNGVWTLMTPYFSHVDRKLQTEEQVLDAIKTVLERFFDCGYKHTDVAWRNICLYRLEVQGSTSEVKAVLIDLVGVQGFCRKLATDGDKTDWVEAQMTKLR